MPVAACLVGLGVGLSALCVPALAQAEPCQPATQNAVLLDLGLHIIGAGYQRTVTCHLVLQASLGLYVPWTVNGDVLGLGGGERLPEGVWDAAGVVLRARPFVFPFGDAPTGFWISPYVQGAYLRGVDPDDNDFGGFGQAEGLSLGYTFAIADVVLVALGAGGQFHSALFQGNTEPPGFALPGPTLDLNVGYAF